mmetsp:Transcript_22481/g.52180  ORF Transcript_22481/g.52180 Transcript_22481/m.52180 type:complete len:89 (-) Transcript_22481:62-328(-)
MLERSVLLEVGKGYAEVNRRVRERFSGPFARPVTWNPAKKVLEIVVWSAADMLGASNVIEGIVCGSWKTVVRKFDQQGFVFDRKYCIE